MRPLGARPLILICWCRMLNWSSVNWTWKHISWMHSFWLVALAVAIGEAFDVSMPFIIASFSNKIHFQMAQNSESPLNCNYIRFLVERIHPISKSPHNIVCVDIFRSVQFVVWLLFWYDLHYFPWTFFALHSNSILFEIMRVISLPRAQFQCPHESHSVGPGLAHTIAMSTKRKKKRERKKKKSVESEYAHSVAAYIFECAVWIRRAKSKTAKENIVKKVNYKSKKRNLLIHSCTFKYITFWSTVNYASVAHRTGEPERKKE